jgi:protein TIF31
MVSRAAKHVFSRYLRKLPLLDVPTCVSHLLNCLIGYKFNGLPPVHFSVDDEFFLRSSQPEFINLSVPRMKQEIVREIYKRFRYRLSGEWWEQCRNIVLLREVCLKMGFQLKARDYQLEKTESVASCPGKTKKSTNGTNGHKVEETTFYPEDILNIVPIVKDAPLKVCPRKNGLIFRVH